MHPRRGTHWVLEEKAKAKHFSWNSNGTFESKTKIGMDAATWPKLELFSVEIPIRAVFAVKEVYEWPLAMIIRHNFRSVLMNYCHKITKNPILYVCNCLEIRSVCTQDAHEIENQQSTIEQHSKVNKQPNKQNKNHRMNAQNGKCRLHVIRWKIHRQHDIQCRVLSAFAIQPWYLCIHMLYRILPP